VGDPDSPRFDLEELGRRTGLPPRTIRYYISEGLVPAPVRRGPASYYREDHLNRLVLIRKYQAEGLPLDLIRRRLARLGVRGAQEEAVGGRHGRLAPGQDGNAALDYIRRLKGGGPAGETAPDPGASPHPWDRWVRTRLSPDVELNVKEPLDGERRRRVERLIVEARKILNE
jgi:DNA-binding transcriptional MerR regulator